jgi:glycosyltransferase involved in cell wall biosynthesis
MSWHILDTGSIWLKEFAAALSTMVPTRNWCPQIRNFGLLENWETTDRLLDPQIEMIRFPLQRGYSRYPLAQLFPVGRRIAERIKRRCTKAENATLICTAPFYAPVAEEWPGQVVYYLTDLTKEYAEMNAGKIVALDRRMCQVAHTVCPNSSRIANYLHEEAGCDSRKISVIPNATREQNVVDQPLTMPAPPPRDMADLPRPIVGIIGNLAGNMDWLMISDAVEKTKNVSWAFVGPTDMQIPDRAHAEARRNLQRRHGRIQFLGPKKYSQLCHYARSFDVALMPYRRQEPTYSGSATRYYEHLAACRPILSSRGFHELLTKEPLLKLVDDGGEIADAVECLKGKGFRDGLEEVRWRESREGTWLVRARSLLTAADRSDRLNVA